MERVPGLVTLILLNFFWATPGYAQNDQNFGWMHANWGWEHMMFGGLMMIIFWGAIILLVIVLVRGLNNNLSGRDSSAVSRQTALEIVKERFAKGEIDKNEYEEKRRILVE